MSEKDYIPYGKQSIDETDIQAVLDVLHSDYLTTGPKIEEFEQLVADYTGARYAVAVSNGTAALHIACLAAGIGPGDEVITTPITFAASANCVLYCGAVPVFADIDARTYNIDPQEIRKKITSRTKAILPVHLAGQPCDLDEIHRIAKEHHLIVIEDGAHALGAEYKGKKIGSLSDMTTFSFHPVKPITTGEGGMVMTNDETLYRKLLLLRSHGITRKEEQFFQNDGPWYYEQQLLGYNYRITDIQCALGISQLKKLDVFLARRRTLAANYQQAFADRTDLVTPYQMEGTQSGWHLYILKLLQNDRKEIFIKLREKGIGVNVHYIPVYLHPYYRTHGYANVCCEKAETLYKTMLSLPLYPSLSDEQQEKVIECVKDL
ncbi:GDP-perosamine synthase [Eubacterium plexicaudatum ASF492]|uniref:UDP-4-keto-6-deoxy-N-acetylglucosamine 4-aminotransferase n=1 Tax=Eubacterium plexicaudatum ASF492 TaxID=1235802 RepID=N2BF12_9FIRM|nr:GDP-perosamine synthase [Eubacterium plexicaudatum ASF492]